MARVAHGAFRPPKRRFYANFIQMKTFLERLLSTVLLLAVFGGAVWWNSSYGYAILICLLCNLATVEWHSMLAGRTDCQRGLLLAAGLSYPWLVAAVASLQVKSLAFLVPGLFLAAFVLLSFLVAMRGPIEGDRPLRSIGTTLLAFVYPVWLFSFSLLFLFQHDRMILLLIWIVLATKMTDIFAYVCGVMMGGRFFGERRFSPKISPKKTWEGIVGSLILSTAAAYFLYLGLTDSGAFWGWSFNWFVPTMIVLFILAVAGDLAGSIVKRSLQVKDSGSALPGIGGVFDLIDSPAFTVAGFSAMLGVVALYDAVRLAW